MPDRLISEEYLVKEYEKHFVRNVRYIMDDLGAHRAAEKKHQWSDRDWERGDHYWIVSDHSHRTKRNRAKFWGHHYDPEKSERIYGDTLTITEDKVQVDGFSKVFDNTEFYRDTTAHIRHMVTVARNVTHILQTNLDTFIESESKFTGEFPGGSFEQSVKLHFGFSLNDTESTSQNVDETEEVVEDIPLPEGKKVIITFEKDKLITETPFSIDGYVDMGITLDFEDWANSKHKQGRLLFGTHKHKNVFKFNNLFDFEQFLNGYHVEHSSMKKYKPSSKSIEAMNWIFSKKNRLIQAEGIKRREFENNVTIKLREVK